MVEHNTRKTLAKLEVNNPMVSEKNRIIICPVVEGTLDFQSIQEFKFCKGSSNDYLCTI